MKRALKRGVSLSQDESTEVSLRQAQSFLRIIEHCRSVLEPYSSGGSMDPNGNYLGPHYLEDKPELRRQDMGDHPIKFGRSKC
jgi:hypothetical protein